LAECRPGSPLARRGRGRPALIFPRGLRADFKRTEKQYAALLDVAQHLDRVMRKGHFRDQVIEFLSGTQEDLQRAIETVRQRHVEILREIDSLYRQDPPADG